MSKKVLLIGSSTMDLTANMFKIPEPGETIFDDGGVAYTPGGKGANSAVAFKRLGGNCLFLTKLGADAHGQRLFHYFKELGVDTSFVKVDNESSTGFSLILRESNKKNRVISYLGANELISPDNIVSAFASRPDALCASLESSFDTVYTASKIASSRGVPIFLDAGSVDKSIRLEALPQVEIFVLDDTAALELTDTKPHGVDNALRVFITLQRFVKAKYMVLRVGERGVFIYDGKYNSVAPAFPIGKVVDSAGAADAFMSALVIEYLESMDIKSAARFASAASALTATRPGAAVSIPTREEVYNFMSKHPNL